MLVINVEAMEVAFEILASVFSYKFKEVLTFRGFIGLFAATYFISGGNSQGYS